MHRVHGMVQGEGRQRGRAAGHPSQTQKHRQDQQSSSSPKGTAFLSPTPKGRRHPHDTRVDTHPEPVLTRTRAHDRGDSGRGRSSAPSWGAAPGRGLGTHGGRSRQAAEPAKYIAVFLDTESRSALLRRYPISPALLNVWCDHMTWVLLHFSPSGPPGLQ